MSRQCRFCPRAFPGSSIKLCGRQHRRPNKRSWQITCSNQLIDSVIGDPEYEKERSGPFGQAVFGHKEWAKHKDPDRYRRHILNLPGSRIVRGLAQPMGGVVAIATLETVYEYCLQAGYLPHWCISILVPSTDPANFSSTALSLLLVFRTNASYDRWLESRNTWGEVVFKLRDLMRQGLTWISPQKEALRQMLRRWIICFPVALRCHLVSGINLQQELKGILLSEEIELLQLSQHQPNYVIRMITEIMKEAQLDQPELVSAEINVSFLSEAVGSCERIFKTPIPLSWTRHTSRSLILWLSLLPLTLYQSCHFASIPITALFAFLLLGIEQIGVQIEEPFSTLPLGHFCRIIEGTVNEMCGVQEECAAWVQRQAGAAPQDSTDRSSPEASSSMASSLSRNGVPET